MLDQCYCLSQRQFTLTAQKHYTGPINKSIGWLVSLFVGQSVGRSVSGSVSRSIGQLVSGSVSLLKGKSF